MGLPDDVVNQVEKLLGRSPRGLEAVAAVDSAGAPAVIRVASLVDDRPFPTLFWLVDPVLCYRIDQLEAGGLIARLQQRIDREPELLRGMRADHRAHIALREAYMRPAVRQRLRELGFEAVFRNKGIGGISDFSRIRCLHTWYGAHLVAPNTVGAMLDDWWARPSS